MQARSLSGTKMSYALIDLDNGKLIESEYSDRPMILASVSKIFTFYFALKVLGPEDHFRTEVHKTGKIVNGVLKGNLYLKGYGAPYFTANHILSLIHQIKSKGIQKIEGKYYYDSSEQWAYPRISELGLEDQTDNPSIGALNVEFNRFRVWTKSNLASPPLKHLIVKSEKRSRKGQKFKFGLGAEGSEIWLKNSKMRMRSIENLPSKNSNLFTSYFFHYLADLHGLSLPDPQNKMVPENSVLLASHKGIPLIRLASLGLEYSNNLIAEMAMLKAVKKLSKGKKSLLDSASYMHKWFKKKFPHINWEGSHFNNASGLNLNNKIGSKEMAQLLFSLQNVNFKDRSFWSLLSINGHSGGLVKRLKHPSLAFRIYGKTGSLYYVNNLAGYLMGKSGKRYAFALFTSHEKNRALLSKLDPEKGRYLRAGSRGWRRKSMRKMDKKLQSWITKL
ncbi:D-alanyl-D-alanine carboxypeptidase [Bacteriovoracales bacterium]|nr:D-alanyl-D-alanine carboxypeptidase [Bacteriovoracales bacterium]